jgi:hypothetical protein
MSRIVHPVGTVEASTAAMESKAAAESVAVEEVVVDHD